ncbi:MAG: glycosyltransferase family 4 protein [Anaerolineae bacterium]
MRIALIAPFGLRAKGTTRARALPLGRALARRGHTVALFVPPYDSPEDAGQRWTDGGVEVINLTLPALGRGGAAWHLWLGWRLFLAVRRWQPDVAHVFKPKGPSGLAGILLWGISPYFSVSASPRPRVVVDADDWEGPGGWNDDPRTGYTAAQRRFFAWQERYGLSHADAWTVTSQCLRERAMAFGAALDHVFILHNGIEPSNIEHRTSNTPHSTCDIPHPPSVLLYTRFAGVRPAEVVEIWGQVRALRPDATLCVLGRGIAGEERALAGVPGITVCGWVEPSELPAALRSARLAIVPWADTPSNRARHSAKVLELMAAGLPIVAYAVGELPVTLGEGGVLVEPGDVATFAMTVVGLLADPARAAALGAAAQARAHMVFNWDALVERALQAYACM